MLVSPAISARFRLLSLLCFTFCICCSNCIIYRTNGGTKDGGAERGGWLEATADSFQLALLADMGAVREASWSAYLRLLRTLPRIGFDDSVREATRSKFSSREWQHFAASRVLVTLTKSSA